MALKCNHKRTVDVFGNEYCKTCSISTAEILSMDGNCETITSVRVKCPMCGAESTHEYCPGHLRYCANCKKQFRMPIKRNRGYNE